MDLQFSGYKIFIATVSLIFGALISFIFQKFQNRTSIFSYFVNTERLAISANDKHFGDIEVMYRGRKAQTLFFSTIIIENSSTKDYENVELKIYTAPDVLLLNDMAIIMQTPQALQYSKEFTDKMQLAPGEKPSDLQWKIYNHSREYLVRVFNRSRKIQIQILSETTGNTPSIFVDIAHKGVKVRYQQPQMYFFGVPSSIAKPMGIISSLTISCVILLFSRNVYISAFTAWITGLIASAIGAWVYKLYKRAHTFVAG